MGANSNRPFLFVTVGTDHHPFNRLIQAVDKWLEENNSKVDCFMQVGTSQLPRFAPSKDYLTYEEMEEYLRRASVVVCHGGPATIMLARFYGKLPVVMPRRKSLGEHVDDHQLFFSRRFSQEGAILLVEDETALFAALEAGLQGKLLFSESVDSDVSPAIHRLAVLIDELFKQKGGRR